MPLAAVAATDRPQNNAAVPSGVAAPVRARPDSRSSLRRRRMRPPPRQSRWLHARPPALIARQPARRTEVRPAAAVWRWIVCASHQDTRSPVRMKPITSPADCRCPTALTCSSRCMTQRGASDEIRPDHPRPVSAGRRHAASPARGPRGGQARRGAWLRPASPRARTTVRIRSSTSSKFPTSARLRWSRRSCGWCPAWCCCRCTARCMSPRSWPRST